MSININLADKKNPEDAKDLRVKKLKSVSLGLLILTAFMSVTIFAIDYRFSASYVRNQQGEMMKELEKFNEPAAMIFVLNSKLDDISSILSQRKKYNNISSEILRGAPIELTIEEFVTDGNEIYIKASSNSLLAIDEFLNHNLNLIESKTLSSITLKSLTLELDSYIIEVIIK